MAWMAGNIGAILAVLLLGCTRTCRMILPSLTIGLNQANRTVCTDRGQTEHRNPRAPGRRAQLAGRVRSKRTCGSDFAERFDEKILNCIWRQFV